MAQRPHPITPPMLRAARDRSKLSYLTLQMKLNCRSAQINDILCGKITSGLMYDKFLEVMDPYWDPVSFKTVSGLKSPPKPVFYGERKKGETAFNTHVPGSARMATAVKPVPEAEEEEEVQQVKDDEGNVIEIPASITFIPRSQGGGLDPNRPKPSVERKRRYETDRPDMSNAGIAARLGQSKEEPRVVAEDFDDDPILDDEDSSEPEEEEKEPTEAELQSIEQEAKGSFAPIPETVPRTEKPVTPFKEPATAATVVKAAPVVYPLPLHGKTCAQIAVAFGCSEETVQRLANAQLRRGYYVSLWKHFVQTGTFLRDKTPSLENTPPISEEPRPPVAAPPVADTPRPLPEEKESPVAEQLSASVMLESWGGALKVPFAEHTYEKVQSVLNRLSTAMGNFLVHKLEADKAAKEVEAVWREAELVGICMNPQHTHPVEKV